MKKIIFEGIDGSGKTALSISLYNYLINSGSKVELYKEYNNTLCGITIKRLLIENHKELTPLDKSLLSFVAMNQCQKHFLNQNFDYVLLNKSHYTILVHDIMVEKNYNIELYNMILKESNISTEDYIVFIDNSPKDVLKYTSKKFDKLGVVNKKGIDYYYKVYKAYQSLFNNKNNVCYIKGYDVQTNLQNLLEYLNIGELQNE